MTFIEFVKAQNPQEPIDHSGCWRTCAVGDYYQAMGMDRPERFDSIRAGELPEFKGAEDLLSALNNYFGKTYRDLQEFIDEEN